MKPLLLFAALAAALAPAVQAEERPNQPVFRSGPWVVVRSVRDAGNVVACTGFYRANRQIQLSKDMLAVKAQVEIKTVAIGFDDEPMRAPRPLSKAESDLGAFAITGDDFARLAKARTLRLDVVTVNGSASHKLALMGIRGALENIEAGCPVPSQPLELPRRRESRN